MDIKTIEHLRRLKPSLKKYGLTRLRVFGSTVRKDYRPDSDVDLLVEFETIPSFFELSDFQDYVEEEINRKVDIVFAHKIFPELRESILREAVDV